MATVKNGRRLPPFGATKKQAEKNQRSRDKKNADFLEQQIEAARIAETSRHVQKQAAMTQVEMSVGRPLSNVELAALTALVDVVIPETAELRRLRAELRRRGVL